MGCLIGQYIERWRDIVLEDQLSEIERTENALKYCCTSKIYAMMSYLSRTVPDTGK